MFAPQQLTLFTDKYNRFDTNPSLPMLLASKPGEILLQEEYFCDLDWARFDPYQEIYRPHRNRHIVDKSIDSNFGH